MRPTHRKAPRSRGWDGAKPALRVMQSPTQQEVGPGLWAATRLSQARTRGWRPRRLQTLCQPDLTQSSEGSSGHP